MTGISINVSKHGAKIPEPTPSASRRAAFKSSGFIGVTHVCGDLRLCDLAWKNVPSSSRLSAVCFRAKSMRPIIYEGIIGTGRAVLFFHDP